MLALDQLIYIYMCVCVDTNTISKWVVGLCLTITKAIRTQFIKCIFKEIKYKEGLKKEEKKPNFPSTQPRDLLIDMFLLKSAF